MWTYEFQDLERKKKKMSPIFNKEKKENESKVTKVIMRDKTKGSDNVLSRSFDSIEKRISQFEDGTPDDLEGILDSYISCDKAVKAMKKKMDRIKPVLLDKVKESGEVDPKDKTVKVLKLSSGASIRLKTVVSMEPTDNAHEYLADILDDKEDLDRVVSIKVNKKEIDQLILEGKLGEEDIEEIMKPKQSFRMTTHEN